MLSSDNKGGSEALFSTQKRVEGGFDVKLLQRVVRRSVFNKQKHAKEAPLSSNNEEQTEALYPTRQQVGGSFAKKQ